MIYLILRVVVIPRAPGSVSLCKSAARVLSRAHQNSLNRPTQSKTGSNASLKTHSRVAQNMSQNSPMCGAKLSQTHGTQFAQLESKTRAKVDHCIAVNSLKRPPKKNCSRLAQNYVKRATQYLVKFS